MGRRRFQESFGRAAPNHYQALGARAFLKLLDVVHHLLGEIHLGFAFLHVGPAQAFYELLVEDCGHGRDRLEPGDEVGEFLRADVEHASRPFVIDLVVSERGNRRKATAALRRSVEKRCLSQPVRSPGNYFSPNSNRPRTTP